MSDKPTVPCPKCKGKGTQRGHYSPYVDDPCSRCKGTGTVAPRDLCRSCGKRAARRRGLCHRCGEEQLDAIVDKVKGA